MSAPYANNTQETASSFDLCRLQKSKQVVDLSPNTLRDWNRRGLRFYRCGKPVYFSKAELDQFIRTGGPSRPYIKNQPHRSPEVFA